MCTFNDINVCLNLSRVALFKSFPYYNYIYHQLHLFACNEIECNENIIKYAVTGSLDEMMTSSDALNTLVIVANKIGDWTFREIKTR